MDGDPEGTLTLTLDRFGEASLFQQTAAVLRERKRTFGCLGQPGADGWGRTSTRRVNSPVHRLLCYIGIFFSVRDFKFSLAGIQNLYNANIMPSKKLDVVDWWEDQQ